MWTFLNETVRILNESAIYLLIGFFFAGMGSIFLSRHSHLSKRLSRGGPKSVVLASIFGLPLPLCSCSVLPAGMALRKHGASKGATSSFLISVPETDVISIALTWGLLGPIFAVIRPVAALITAISTGLLVDLVDGKSVKEKDPLTCPKGNCNADKAAAGQGTEWADQPSSVFGWLRRSVRYGFVDIFDELIVQLLIGILIAGAVTALLPDLEFLRFARSSIWGYVIMVGIGIPTYVCASAATPIAAGLIAGGISPGAALVFLLAGPATNTASLVVLGRNFGRKAMLAYLLPVAAISVLMGVAVDRLFGNVSIPIVKAVEALNGSPSFLEITATILFAYLVLKSLHRMKILGRFAARAQRMFGTKIPAPAAKGTVLILVLLAYLSSGLFIVGPGERGTVKRFGDVTAAYLPPGLHYHWPSPFGGKDIVSVRKLLSLEYGVRRGEPMPADLPGIFENLTDAPVEGAGTWLLTGDENLTDVQCIVHYQVRDTEEATLQYLYGVSDKEGLVRSGVEWALATEIASRGIDSLLTVDRESIEENIRDDLLQPFLDVCKSGIRVVDVNLLEVHAPAPVHWSFRDVASAAEDRMQRINMAKEYRERVIREAGGQAAGLVSGARGEAVVAVEVARGEGAAFVVQAEAYGEGPLVTRSRLYLQYLDRVLPNLTKYVNLTEGLHEGIDLWLGRGSGATGPPFVPQSPRTFITAPEDEVQ